jgi:phosphoglycolate phosphatase-like HAD superfamily hydrolase
MSHVTQIFLDLDGPLLDGKERHYFCYRTILEKHSFVPIGIDQYWELKRDRGNRRDLLDLSGAGLIYDEFLTEWLTMIESPDGLAFDKVQEGAVECLRSWKEQGIRLTLVTMRKKRQALEDQLHSTGLLRFLDAVLVCDHADGGLGKADAVRTLSQGEVNENDALWIGDTEADWEAAKSLGCQVVLLSNGLRTEQYLRTLAGAMVKPSIASLKGES